MIDPDETDDFLTPIERRDMTEIRIEVDLPPLAPGRESAPKLSPAWKKRTAQGDTSPDVCPDCGHDHETLECPACPEGYCGDRAGTAEAENDFAADLPEREA